MSVDPQVKCKETLGESELNPVREQAGLQQVFIWILLIPHSSEKTGGLETLIAFSFFIIIWIDN